MTHMAGGSTQWRGRSVISKVVSLLDAFGPDTPELSLSQLAAVTGLPVSTTYRLATELVAWGGLERADGTGYRIGVRLWQLGALARPGATLREVALPLMQDLHEATGETVHLAVRDGYEALDVDTVPGRGAVRARSRRAGRVPLHATAVGKALLAHAPPQVLNELVQAGLRRYTEHTVVVPSQLRRALADVRRTGLAYAREEFVLGSLSVGAPIYGPDGDVVAALAVVLRPGRGDLRRFGPAVRTAANATSRTLAERAPSGATALRIPAPRARPAAAPGSAHG